MVNAARWLRRDIGDEFAGARLGDARRSNRLQSVARVTEDAPKVGFPQMVETDGELEGIYRFLRNEDVTAGAILAPPIAATMQRARQVGHCLVLHDTTAFEFSGAREDLGLTNGKGQGFYAHFALAVLPGLARIPLGVCGLDLINRKVRKDTERKRHSYYIAQDPKRESLRWLRVVESIELQREGFDCIHVMDREGDMYDLMALAKRLETRFIIRGDDERALADAPGSTMRDLLAQTKRRAHRKVLVNKREPKRRELIKPRRGVRRKQRIARLSVGSHVVQIRRPGTSKAPERSLTINVVHVWEPKPPKGEDALEWILFTTEAVDTPEQLHTVVDNYQSRWVIEEFFKALKTGCAFEKRQLESFHALSNALAVFSVVAWRMLLARSVSRAQPQAGAGTVLTKTQLRLVQHKLKLTKLPATAKEAAFAVARLGGHLKRNGDPGWLTLGRGFERLIFLEAGWHAAAAHFSKGDVINP
jgi:hypothetical protein